MRQTAEAPKVDHVYEGYGGAGKTSDITGEELEYAGGGGGCGNGSGATAGKGTAGGGDGASVGGTGTTQGGDAAENSGSGGGGGQTGRGGNGGSGVVVIRYAVSGGDPGPVGPTADGGPVDFDEATFRDTTKVNSSKTVLFPSKPEVAGRTITYGGKSVTMRDYYDVSVQSASGQWQLVLALNDKAKPAFADGESGEKAIAVEGGTVSLHLGGTQEGLWYALGFAGEPGAADADWALGKWQQSGDFEAGTEGASQKFYKVFVRDYEE